MHSLGKRRIDAWTALAAEPAVRAAERAIVTKSPTVLAETLAISTAAESRRRLMRVLELKNEADTDPARREAYQRAADDLRRWAAAVYLAAHGEPGLRQPARAADDGIERSPGSVETSRNPYTEESISLRRSIPRAPFPGQRRRHPSHPDAASIPAVDDGATRERVPTLDDPQERGCIGRSVRPAA